MPSIPAGAGTPQLDLARVRAFVLTKQGLAGPGLTGVYQATRQTGGIYATAPTCYLSYAARVRGFAIADLDEELYRKRRLVRLRCMHGMSYIVAVDALPFVLPATRPDLKADARLARYAGMDLADFAALADRVEAAMTGAPPATMARIRELLGAGAPAAPHAVQLAVTLLCRHSRLVRAEVRGGWASDAYTYARWADWLGEPVEEMDPGAARRELARAYLSALGPATVSDLKWWAGWTVKDTRATIASLGADVSTVLVSGRDCAAAEYLVLTGDLERLAQPSAEGLPVVLLPVWDAYTMGYTDRTRIVPASRRGRVYDRSGNGTSMLLLDGVAAGVWELRATPGRLVICVAPFEDLSQRRWRAIEHAAGELAETFGTGEPEVHRAVPTGELADGASKAFMSPIKLGAAFVPKVTDGFQSAAAKCAVLGSEARDRRLPSALTEPLSGAALTA